MKNSEFLFNQVVVYFKFVLDQKQFKDEYAKKDTHLNASHSQRK